MLQDPELENPTKKKKGKARMETRELDLLYQKATTQIMISPLCEK